MIHFLEKVKKFLKLLIIANYKFTFPPKKNTIVLDLDSSNNFLKLFKKNKSVFLNTRYKELYLLILIYSVFKYFFNSKKTLLQHYIINCIKYVDPKNILTFTDNNLFFLNLKKIFNQKKLIIFQYAWLTRLTFDDMYLKKENIIKKYNVDYTCIWGENSKNFYNQFIDTKYLITGSIKNNFFQYKNQLDKNSIIFISQFRMHFDYDKKNKTYKKDIFKDNVLKNILNYCLKKNYKLKILGCAIENSLYEENYFNFLLGKKNFIFLKRNNPLCSYEYSLRYKYFITFCSSLGYELMSVGKRVAFLPWKSEFFIKNNKVQFNQSFYSSRYKVGPMWSNLSFKKEIYRILNYIINTKNNRWKKIQKKLINPIIVYDKNNNQVKKLFKKLNIN
jgi:surface carbohydrate biosynthesis protein